MKKYDKMFPNVIYFYYLCHSKREQEIWKGHSKENR